MFAQQRDHLTCLLRMQERFVRLAPQPGHYRDSVEAEDQKRIMSVAHYACEFLLEDIVQYPDYSTFVGVIHGSFLSMLRRPRRGAFVVTIGYKVDSSRAKPCWRAPATPDAGAGAEAFTAKRERGNVLELDETAHLPH